MKMTVDQFQTTLHNLYLGDNNTPSSSDTEYTVRLQFLVDAIRLWEGEKDIMWNELWTSLASAADGDKSVNSDDLVYSVPTDFKFLGGHVRTYTVSNSQTYWQVVKPQEAELYLNKTGYWVYLTGNKSSGISVNFGTQPTVGDTIDYPYYKDAAIPTTGTDVIEMSNPMFAVYLSLSKMHEQDGDGDRAAAALGTAEELLLSMRRRNAKLPHYQPNQIQDRQYAVGHNGFGN